MPIHHWPQGEQPREKLLAQGPTALSDAELLAIFLRTGVAGKSAVDLARDLMQTFGSLRSLLNAEHKQLCAFKGMGTTKYVQLQACLELSKRYFKEPLRRGDAIKNPQDTQKYLRAQLRDRHQEVFVCLFLDAANRVISYEELFFGSISATAVYPRQVVKRALFHNANAVIVAHNHPSGVNEPSQADCHLTGQLQQALGLLDIRLLDHLVIGDGPAYSMAEHGLM